MSDIAAPATRFHAGPRLPDPDMAGLVLTGNERRVLDIVNRRAGATRADVTHETELTAQSISRIVDGLIERDLLSLGEKVVNGRGQPSARLILNRDAAYGVGISIMTDAISAAVMNLSGGIVATDSIHLTERDRDSVFATAQTLFERVTIGAGIDRRRIAGVGAAVTGYFVGQGRQVNPPDPLGDLAFIDLDAVLVRALQRPIWVENDGKTAAMGEALTGVGRRFATFAYVFFSMGIGGAVVIDGKVVPGVFGNAGEFGAIWSPDAHDERPTLELLRTMMARRGADHADIHAMVNDFDVDAPGVEDWIALSLPKLDQMASAISAVLDPEAIVLGGRIPKRLAERLAERMSFYGVPRRGVPKPIPRVVVSTVEGDAAAIGAAATPLKARFFG